MNSIVKNGLGIVLLLLVGVFIPFLGESIVHFNGHEIMSERKFYHLLFRSSIISLVINLGILLIQKKTEKKSP